MDNCRAQIVSCLPAQLLCQPHESLQQNWHGTKPAAKHLVLPPAKAAATIIYPNQESIPKQGHNLIACKCMQFQPPQDVYRQHLTSRNPANCIWSRTLGNSCRSSGLEVTALEQIMKTQVQLISTHIKGGGDGNCFSRNVRFSLEHTGKML